MHIERLGPQHDLTKFSCGVKELDDWLRKHASENQRRDLSRTFVLLDDADQVIGYYSLAMGGVRAAKLPVQFGRGLPGYEIGMVLLARLAIDHGRQGEGLGRDLLVDAVIHAVAAGTHAAARFLAVDPIDDAARSFYRAFGFQDVPGDVGGRMYLRLIDAIAALDEGSPA